METNRTCPSCKKPLAADVPMGLCPECLIKSGFPTGMESGAESASAKQPPFVPPTAAELAVLFPQLEILELIGKGGMGAVYKARQPKLNRFVALKILPSSLGVDPTFSERFTREAQALARLNHPGIVTLYEFGQAGGLPFFMMELVEGVNLRQLLERGRISAHEALAIVPQICDALQFAHDQGIVHRDIKPENILLDRRGRVKLADFGVAKLTGGGNEPAGGEATASASLTEAGKIMGTPRYMSPEQLEHPAEVDHRADIYALGVVFYQMLTGELPERTIKPPSNKVQLDVRLDEVVLRALQKEPEDRYQQAGQVKDAVETIALTWTNESSPQDKNKPRRVMEKQSDMKLWFGIGIGIACVLIVYAAWSLMPHGNPAQLVQEGWQLLQGQQRVEALEKFNQAVKLAPKNADALNGLGWALANSGKPAEAEAAFRKAVLLKPNDPAILNGLGQTCLNEKHYDEAEMYLLKAAPKAPAAWFGLARLYLIQGKFDDAEEWAKKIVDSGQGGDMGQQMLQAARDKKLPDALRIMLDPESTGGGTGPSAAQPAKKSPTADEIRNTDVKEWFDRMGAKEAQLGYDKFSAMNALIKKANQTSEIKDQIIQTAAKISSDPLEDAERRWQCCYVLSGIGDKKGIAAIAQALKDDNEQVRSVAACALGQFNDPDARTALEAAAKTEKAASVQESISKALKGDFLKKK